MRKRPTIGQALYPVKTIQNIGLVAKTPYTVTAVRAPMSFQNRPLGPTLRAAEGDWQIQTDKTGTEWYALIYFKE